MKIAVLSGKGGTGKTTVSASLALSIDRCQYVDCDVEEPNGWVFLRPEIKDTIPVNVLVPEADTLKCNGCGNCGKACQFHAIAVVKGKVLVFPEICHHCGACLIACPHEAIREVYRETGVIEINGNNTFLQGRLNIGEPISIPVIRELKKRLRNDMTVILDCSPGASCTVVQSVDGCDYCILVTEPTPFGLHDLKIAVQLIRKMGIPFGVVVNKASKDNQSVQEYCKGNHIEVLMEIPYSQEIAGAYSNGILPVENNGDWKSKFKEIYQKIERGADK
ncbi:4Fe-4S binding protein [Pseudobacteroides cellulosolvens]|uniref:Cobyrinic acid ac-diamide synthase n=1 Tax=Pseudobacteroides cellulosolvens ATCC 35603 = DSM 2933 TaxID=398512 RepID=A0A0L6JUH5_9FIRM|nr:ATP-binding protein [Pseudobacteroides cellulosolvens]KNY29473.1 Cobyrinic acid ac-diamide synthase [Pseudobacteroides cellulosolvens ATCC 35603 = DSM 2933]